MTLVIVTLCLVALFGMLVLVVDVGGLLLNRREMVNASDAAALSAAKSCILPASKDPMLPEDAADLLASDNTVKAKWNGIANIQQMTAPCKPASKTGYVSVEYQSDQHLFFAPVLGGGSTGGITTQATVVWGPPKSVNPLPLVVYQNSFTDCDLDEDPTPGPNCYIWEDNSNTAGAQSGFGYLDLRTDNPSRYGWDSDAGATCSNTGEIKGWVEDYPSSDIGDLPVNYPDPTYVCRLDGGSSSVFGNDVKKDGPIYDLIDDDDSADQDDEEDIIFFPINRCDTNTVASFGQLDRSGDPTPCGMTPNQYDIIGFVALKLINVYTPNQAAGQTDACSITVDFNASSPNVDLDTRSAVDCGSTGYDSITNVQLKKGSACCTNGNQYSFDPLTNEIDWQDGNVNGVRITWDTVTNGQCGTPPANNNSGHCLVVQVQDVVIGGSDPTNNDGANGNIRAYRLCEPSVPGSCNPFAVPPVP